LSRVKGTWSNNNPLESSPELQRPLSVEMPPPVRSTLPTVLLMDAFTAAQLFRLDLIPPPRSKHVTYV
jgi:hypothetical protein